MLKAENLSIGYGENIVLQGVFLSVDKSTFLGIIGVNGSGKSTLLKSLCGKIELISGNVYYKDGRVLGPSETLIPGHSSMKMVTQDSKLDLFMTSKENLETCFHQKDKKYILERIDFLSATFGLDGFLSKPPKSISGGQRQRLALAMALAEPPEVLLLDEPFSQIDQIGAFDLLKGLKDIQRMEDLSIIMVSHQTSHIRMFSNRCIVLDKGKLCQEGSFEQIYLNPMNETVARLTGFYGVIDDSIIRPESVLIHEGDQEALVEENLRLAGNFLLELDYQSQKFFACSDKAIEPQTKIKFKIKD